MYKRDDSEQLEVVAFYEVSFESVSREKQLDIIAMLPSGKKLMIPKQDLVYYIDAFRGYSTIVTESGVHLQPEGGISAKFLSTEDEVKNALPLINLPTEIQRQLSYLYDLRAKEEAMGYLRMLYYGYYHLWGFDITGCYGRWRRYGQALTETQVLGYLCSFNKNCYYVLAECSSYEKFLNYVSRSYNRSDYEKARKNTQSLLNSSKEEGYISTNNMQDKANTQSKISKIAEPTRNNSIYVVCKVSVSDKIVGALCLNNQRGQVRFVAKEDLPKLTLANAKLDTGLKIHQVGEKPIVTVKCKDIKEANMLNWG